MVRISRILPEFVWSSSWMGERRYRWLNDYAFQYCCRGNAPVNHKWRVFRILRRMLLSPDVASASTEDLDYLRSVATCGIDYSMWWICDFALTLEAASPPVLWDILRRMARDLIAKDEWSVPDEAYEQTARQMMCVALEEATPEFAFVGAVQMLEFLSEKVLVYFPRTYSSTISYEMFRPPVSNSGARALARVRHIQQRQKMSGFGRAFLENAAVSREP